MLWSAGLAQVCRQIHPPVREQIAAPVKAKLPQEEESAPVSKQLFESAKTIAAAQQALFIAQVVDAIERIHGRLGKILIAQYLSGSQNAKIQNYDSID